MVLDTNVMENVIWISKQVTLPIDVSHASNMTKTRVEGRNSRDWISFSVDDKSTREDLIKVSLQTLLEGSRLTKRVEHQVVCWNAKVFVEDVHRDGGHGSSKRMTCEEDLLGRLWVKA